jgi:predicted transcriptional regulator
MDTVNSPEGLYVGRKVTVYFICRQKQVSVGTVHRFWGDESLCGAVRSRGYRITIPAK